MATGSIEKKSTFVGVSVHNGQRDHHAALHGKVGFRLLSEVCGTDGFPGGTR